MKIAKNVVHRFGRWYAGKISRREYEAQHFVRVNERPIEYGFAFEWLNRLQPRTVLDVGTGKSALPSLLRTCGYLVTATDNIANYWSAGMHNRHYHVINDDIRDTRLTHRFDAVTCISVLEHIREHEAAVSSMLQLLSDDGYLILTIPYQERTYVPNVYELPRALYGSDFPFICQSYSRVELNKWLLQGNAEVVAQDYWRCFTDGIFSSDQKKPSNQLAFRFRGSGDVKRMSHNLETAIR